MSFSLEWDERYKENTHMSIWPWSDLVSYTMRYARPTNKKYRVLELGCGAGANIPFFNKLGVQYYAIDGSTTIIDMLQKQYPDMKDNLVVADITRNIPFEGNFDLVVDRATLTHNHTDAIINCLNIVSKKLNVGGKYIGIDWFSTLHSEYKNGIGTDDLYSKKGYSTGQFANTGIVHFSDKPHLEKLFSAFKFEILEHKMVNREIPEGNYAFASWNFVAVKE